MPPTSEEYKTMTTEEIDIREHKINNYPTWKTEEVQLYINNRKIRALKGQNRNVRMSTDGTDIMLTRILGFKAQIPGIARWQMETVQEPDTCPVCDGWNYTLYFWNEQIGRYDDVNHIGIENYTKVNLVKTIRA